MLNFRVKFKSSKQTVSLRVDSSEADAGTIGARPMLIDICTFHQKRTKRQKNSAHARLPFDCTKSEVSNQFKSSVNR